MIARLLPKILITWALCLALACAGVHAWIRIDPAAMPSREAERWALAYLEASLRGAPLPAAPADARSYRGAGPIFVFAWHRGVPVVRHVGADNLEKAVVEGARAFAADTHLRELLGERVEPTVVVTLGEGPIVRGIPFLSSLGVVPLREGLVVRIDGKEAFVTSDELLAEGAYDAGETTPIPDLTMGVALEAILDRLARELGHEHADLMERGEGARLRTKTIASSVYPREEEVTEESLRRASVEGAEFLLRLQKPDGSYTYTYDARRGAERPDAYNLPRHAGTTYFLAQMDRLQGMPAAREGAIRALRWLEGHGLRRCGGADRWCVDNGGRADVGTAALSAIAAAELLDHREDPWVRELLVGLTAFLRGQQRPDGELMHEWNFEKNEPVDVQHLYYSGEALLAFVRAHDVLRDPRDLEAAQRLMTHLTGAGWTFFGSRYYYGEEHWTCIAAGEAREKGTSAEATDFCQRWSQWNRELQIAPGQTPWSSAGALGVGPVIVPRLTPVASRGEAFISTYELLRHRGIEDAALRAQIEKGLGMLLRWRFSPGPTHLLADPEEARGGMPGSAVDLNVRNDYVQHAGSAWIRWADLLRREREGKR